MLSTDKNVDTLARLIEALKDYIGLRKEFLKLDVADKLVRLLTALSLGIIVFFIVVGIFFYLSFAVVHWLSPYIGMGWAFAAVALILTLLLCFVYALRKPLIINPLVRLLTGILLGK